MTCRPWSGWRSSRRWSCIPRSRWPRRPTGRPSSPSTSIPARRPTCSTAAGWPCGCSELFGHFGLECFPKTSGSKGLQVYVPLNTETSYEETKPFARAIAQLLEKQTPDLVVSKMKKVEREGKVFVDWSQNHRRKTTIAVYSLRRPRATHRLYPAELGGGRRGRWSARTPARSSLRPPTCWQRVGRDGDLFAPVLELEQELPEL